MSECDTCVLLARRDAGEAPLWDAILRTEHWDVVHNLRTSVEGWLVLVVRRHITAVGDLGEAEAGELGGLLARTSRALRAVLDVPKTYVAQYAEHVRHPHVHFHVIPRAADLPEELRGPRIFGALSGGVPVPEERMNEIAVALREHL